MYSISDSEEEVEEVLVKDVKPVIEESLEDALRHIHQDSLRFINNFRTSGIKTSKDLQTLKDLPDKYQVQHMETIKEMNSLQRVTFLAALAGYRVEGEE